MSLKKESKHVPARSCAVCRVKSDKHDLIRLVKSPEGKIVIDISGKLQGRGTYICPDSECVASAKKSGILERELKAKVDEDFWQALDEHIKHYDENKILKIRSILGLARRAGVLLIGSERIKNENSLEKKILVILANDSSDGIKKFAASYNDLLTLDITIKELSEVAGLRDSVQILGLPLKSGFAKKILELTHKN